MRVVSWNLQHGVPDPKGPAALALAEEPLRALEGDVYALQELDRRRCRTGFAHQGVHLGKRLDGELVWARAKRVRFGSQSNALVVRGEVVEREVVHLPGGGELRVLALAVVVVRGGRWTIGCTHLSLDKEVSPRQLRAAVAAFHERPKPWLLLGDLNLTTDRVRPLADELGLTLLDGPPTIDARGTLTRRLDHLLMDGATVTASGVEKLPVSDHLAIWADVS